MENKNHLVCPSCHAPRPEKYCSKCGEKKVEAADFTLRNILGQGFSFITNLDSKLYNTIIGLLFKPGALPLAYIEGRRNSYMKPFQVFVLSSIFFYLLMSDMDIFLVPSQWYFTDRIAPIVERIMAERNLTWEGVAEIYDRAVVNNSKLFIFLLLPFYALLFYILNWKKEKEFGKHLILAVYQLSFFLILSASTDLLGYLPIGPPPSKWWIITPIVVIYLIYVIIGIRRVFKRSFMAATFQGVVVFFCLSLLILAYRNGISYVTLTNL